MAESFAEILTTQGLIALVTLSLLEIVLGIDNVIFIAILSGSLPKDQQERAPLRQMAFAESGASIRSVMIAGRMVLDEGRMTTIDETALRARAQAAAERLDTANADAIRGAEAMAGLVGCFCLAHAKEHCDVVRMVHG